MHCMIVTFPSHTHLPFETCQGYIGCLGWYALYNCEVSWHTHYLGRVRVISGAWDGMHCIIVKFPGILTYYMYLGPVMVIMRAWVGMHCMIVLFPGHTHYLGPVRIILGAWVGMLCMIVTFPSHTHLLFGTFQGYIGCLGWYALNDSDVSRSYSLTIWDLLEL